MPALKNSVKMKNFFLAAQHALTTMLEAEKNFMIMQLHALKIIMNLHTPREETKIKVISRLIFGENLPSHQICTFQ